MTHSLSGRARLLLRGRSPPALGFFRIVESWHCWSLSRIFVRDILWGDIECSLSRTPGTIGLCDLEHCGKVSKYLSGLCDRRLRRRPWLFLIFSRFFLKECDYLSTGFIYRLEAGRVRRLFGQPVGASGPVGRLSAAPHHAHAAPEPARLASGGTRARDAFGELLLHGQQTAAPPRGARRSDHAAHALARALLDPRRLAGGTRAHAERNGARLFPQFRRIRPFVRLRLTRAHLFKPLAQLHRTHSRDLGLLLPPRRPQSELE